jgi:hypothetical protein
MKTKLLHWMRAFLPDLAQGLISHFIPFGAYFIRTFDLVHDRVENKFSKSSEVTELIREMQEDDWETSIEIGGIRYVTCHEAESAIDLLIQPLQEVA